VGHTTTAAEALNRVLAVVDVDPAALAAAGAQSAITLKGGVVTRLARRP
jgi:hypothetical protein